jgi:hypothetical protein
MMSFDALVTIQPAYRIQERGVQIPERALSGT